MPVYTFDCDNCKSESEKFFSIPEFMEAKSKIIKCEECGNGSLTHKIASVSTLVEKSKDQIIMDIQDEVQKTVNKISKGDLRTIEDVYGDRANPYK